MFEDLSGFTVGLDQHVVVVLAQEVTHPVDSAGIVQHHPHQVGTGMVTQDAMDEIFIAVEQHGWHR